MSRRRLSTHRVHAVVNRPLLIWGLERRLWILVAVVPAATFQLTDGVTPALVLFVAFYVIARVVTARDPQWPAVLMKSRSLRRVYDVGQYQPLPLMRHRVCDE